MMGQANMLVCTYSVVTQVTNIYCHARSLNLSVEVLAWMHPSYAGDIDVTTLKTELESLLVLQNFTIARKSGNILLAY